MIRHPTAAAGDTLRRAGIANPARLLRLLNETVAALELDLAGLVVLTEAASGPYMVTPVLAALAGADRVLALTRDSRYAPASIVIAQTQALAAWAGLSVAHAGAIGAGGLAPAIGIHTVRSADLFAAADIVTNLGFVRPLDAAAVSALKPTAVVPLMCEAWEVRPDDVALDVCRQRGIPVLGTNEDHPAVDVFAYSGPLCLKLLFDAQIEVHKSRIVIVSGDQFGPVIEHALARAGAAVRRFPDLRNIPPADLVGADALIIADYTRPDMILGPDGDLTGADLARTCPAATVVQFAGRVAVTDLTRAGIAVHPGLEFGPHRMAVTLAGLGPRPVVELHAAGLKVGELAARARLTGVPSAALTTVYFGGHVIGESV